MLGVIAVLVTLAGVLAALGDDGARDRHGEQPSAAAPDAGRGDDGTGRDDGGAGDEGRIGDARQEPGAGVRGPGAVPGDRRGDLPARVPPPGGAPTGGGGEGDGGTGSGRAGGGRCPGPQLCVGAAARVVSPTERHIEGVLEPRLFLGTHRQRFNLGGFGIDPLQSFPDPIGAFGDTLTVPASVPAYEGSHGREDTWVRAMVIEQPDGPSVALVTLDAIGAGNIVQEGLTTAVARATGIPAANVLFGQTHTHAGPDLQGLWGGVPHDWIERVLYPRAVAAVQAAQAASRPATIAVRHGDVEAFNGYRRPRRLDPDVDADTTATLVQAHAVETGEVVANLLQFNAHPTSIDEDPRAPHPDYVLGALDWIERHEGGVALYFNGPIADASPSGTRAGCAYPGDGAYGEVRCRGEGLAAAVLSFPVDRTLQPTLEVRRRRVLLPVTNPLFLAGGLLGAFNRYYDFLQLPVDRIPLVGEQTAAALGALPQLTPAATTLVSRVTIGGVDHGLELVTLPGEATGTFGEFVKGLARPGAHVALLGLTHNSFGYILPEEEFSYIDASGDAGFLVPYTGYEEFVSLGPLTAPLLRAQAYVPLFGADPARALPPVLTACLTDLTAEGCVLHVIGRHLDYARAEVAADCRAAGLPEAVCGLLHPRLEPRTGRR